MAWKKQGGLLWDLERLLMELKGSERKLGEPLTELGRSWGSWEALRWSWDVLRGSWKGLTRCNLCPLEGLGRRESRPKKTKQMGIFLRYFQRSLSQNKD